jgi:hypothetical protein
MLMPEFFLLSVKYFGVHDALPAACGRYLVYFAQQICTVSLIGDFTKSQT